MKLTTHSYLALRLIICGAITPLSPCLDGMHIDNSNFTLFFPSFGLYVYELFLWLYFILSLSEAT